MGPTRPDPEDSISKSNFIFTNWFQNHFTSDFSYFCFAGEGVAHISYMDAAEAS